MTDQNLSNFIGEIAEKNFTISDDDGNPIDLTDSSVDAVALTVATGLQQYGETKFEKQASNIDSNGNAKFTIQNSDTADLRPGNYLYQVMVEYTGTTNYVAEVGKYFLKAKVDK